MSARTLPLDSGLVPRRDGGDFPYDASPESAIRVITAHDGPILVDLDETLYLRNSTEDFIDTAQPGLAALVILRVLDALKPWRFSGGEPTRDAWRVRAIAFLLPWTLARWRLRTTELARLYLNRPLLAALRSQKETPIIVTAGFSFIVIPLIKALGLEHATVVATRGFGCADRRSGKLHRAVESLGAEIVRQSLVITDSEQDHSLLAASAQPLRTVWPEAVFLRALSRVYLPGEYLTQVKRPGERYIFRGIIQEDFAFWILASIGLAAVPAMHVAGLTCLLISFWAIYERGYVDNDWVAAAYETDPKLTAAFHTSMVATPVIQPWLWAAGAGTAGIFLLRWPLLPDVWDFAKWLGLLLATHLWFKLYNRCDKNTRIWMFPFLQFARTAAPIVLIPVMPIGAVVFGAQVLSRWVPYYVYRVGVKDWPKEHTHLIRVLFIIVLGGLLVAAAGIGAVLNWTALALFVWALFRARREVVAVGAAARRLDKEPPAVMMTVSVCIATYRRPDRLTVLLQDLTQQQRPPDELIVVDNDAGGSAKAVVDRRLDLGAPFPIRYDVQPIKNISLTRNRTVQLATGEWLAFVDDDERAPSGWLRQLLEAAQAFTADGILGPVDPVVPAAAPNWIKRGAFYDFPRMPSGTVVAPNRLRFGNVLLRGSCLRSLPGPFDPAYGLTGGEDGDMLSRLAMQGARLVWCDEALVQEPVEASRLSLRWLLRRALSGGQDFARHTLGGRYGELTTLGRVRFFMRALAQALLAAALALLTWPLGRHHAARWLTTVSANLGKMSVFWGWQYREYA